MAKRQLIGASCAALIAVVGLSAATQMVAAHFAHQPALTGRFVTIAGQPIYQPLAILDWSRRWSATYPRDFAGAKLIVFLSMMGAALVFVLALKPARPDARPFGKDAWGGADDAALAGLFASGGVILGKLGKEMLAYDGPHHLLLTGGTRSGKTRGAVVPTLLASPHSVLALDLKGELHSGDARVGFPGTSGWRAKLGPVIRFDPTSATSDRFNLIDTIRPGPNEVRDVQNLVELIADPYGDQRFQEFWDRAAKQMLGGFVIHVAYAEPEEKKNLYRVFELLARADEAVKLMEATFHRLNATTGEPETHPEVKRAAQSYAAYHDKLRAGIKATAESYLGLFADPLVQQNTAVSTFRASDLMCADTPITLFLCWPPNDSKRVKPLMRLVFGAVLRDLMEHQERASDGRTKRRPLLLLLDEFAQLGKLDLFEQSMPAMAGYGLRAFIITQSLHQVTQAYGRHNTILDNCQVVASFAATDVETAETVSKLAGDIYEMRPQETWSGKRQIFGLDHRAITYREERRPLILPAQVRQLPDRDELIFVTGAKPLKAKKLRYDEEPIFAPRLFPTPALQRREALPSPWAAMRAVEPAAPTEPAEQAEQAPVREAATAPRAATRPANAKSRSGQHDQQADLLALIDTPPSQSGAPAPPPPNAPKPPSDRVGFDLRPKSDSDDAKGGAL